MASTINASTSSGIVQSADTSGVLQLQTANTTALTIDGSQNVGIGTSSPTRKLQVSNTVSDPFISISGAASNEGGLLFGDNASDASGQVRYNHTSDAMYFATNGSERMRIDTSGNVGIGTNSPNGKLDVLAGTGADLLISADATNLLSINNYSTASGFQNLKVVGSTLQFFTGTAGGGSASERARIDSSGNLLVGSTSVGSSVGFQLQIAGNGTSKPAMNVNGASTSSADAGYILYSTTGAANKFYVDYAGTVHAVSTSITAISDQTLKTNIKPLETGLAQILALQPKRYDWLDGTGENIAGFIAQEVQEVLPDLVSTFKYNEEESKLGLRMGDILPTLVKAVQEQQALIQQLTTRLEALENK